MNQVQRVLIGAKSLIDKTGALKLEPVKTLYWYLYLAYKRFYESRSFVQVLDYLSKDNSAQKFSCILDVGAHIGSSSYFISRYFPNAEIIAFEPDPRNVEFFNHFNRQRLKGRKMALIGKAVWKSSGEIPFVFQPSNTADNKYDPSSENQVACISIDDFVLGSINKIDLIKIDVQGYEWEVLEGAIGTIRLHRPRLILELDLDALGERQSLGQDLLRFLWKLNYRVIDPISGKLLTAPVVYARLSSKRCLDLLFVPFTNEMTDKE